MRVGMLPQKQVFALVSMLGVSHLVHEDNEHGTTHPKAVNSSHLVWNEAGICKGFLLRSACALVNMWIPGTVRKILFTKGAVSCHK